MARVIGTVTSSTKAKELIGVKLLLIQPKDHHGKDRGKPIVAVDTVQAGVGDLVYWVGGREAAASLDEKFVAVDAGIVGIVDQVNT